MASLVFFVSGCHGGLFVRSNAASLSIEVNVPNKALLLTYEFESPVRKVQFAYSPERARSSGWSVVDSEFELIDNSLSRVDFRPFTRVIIKVGIEQDISEQDESALSAIGDVGLVLFNAYLSLRGIRITDIVANITQGQVVVHGGYISGVDADSISLESAVSELHHIYFGDRSALSYVDNIIVVSRIEPDNNSLMVIRDSVGPAMRWIEEFFDISGQNRPIIIVRFIETNDSNRAEFLGVAAMTPSGLQTSSGEIMLSFRGDARTWEDGRNEYLVQHGMVHELVHFAHYVWWGSLRFGQLWLMEGLADYLAIKYAHSVGGCTDDKSFYSEIKRLASECLNILETGNIGISRTRPQDGLTPYDECGVFAYWLIDGRPTVAPNTDRLGMVLARMKEMPGTFSVGNLMRAMDTGEDCEASELLQMLIEGPRSRMWHRRDEFIREAGIRAPSSSSVASGLG